MIIVEGMDNSGKTKLAEYLAEKFELPHIKSPKDRTHIIGHTLQLLVLNPEAVMDRFPVISERIYGRFLRNKIAFDGEVATWQFYFEKLVRCRPLIFYCRPPEEKIFDFGSREQMEGVFEYRKELLACYDILMAEWDTRLVIMRYNFTLPEAKFFAEFAVKTYLSKRRIDRYEYTGC